MLQFRFVWQMQLQLPQQLSPCCTMCAVYFWGTSLTGRRLSQDCCCCCCCCWCWCCSYCFWHATVRKLSAFGGSWNVGPANISWHKSRNLWAVTGLQVYTCVCVCLCACVYVSGFWLNWNLNAQLQPVSAVNSFSFAGISWTWQLAISIFC